MDTRREFLKKAALISGAAGLSGISGLLVESIQRAQAIEPDPGSTFWDAEHVVILMQENRSFDHAYGTLRGVRGFNDPRAIKLPNGNPVWVQTDPQGKSYVPFRLNMRDTNSTWTGCLPHNWTDQVDARHEGAYDRWLHVKRSDDGRYAQMPLTLGYYNRDDIPFYYELADAFTICDQNFCSSLTGTTPNRLHLWTGTIRAEQSATSPAHLLNSDADHATNVQWITFPERLEDAGISWKIYQNELSVGTGLTPESDPWLANFGDNPIEYFTQFHVRFTANYQVHLAHTATDVSYQIALLEERIARTEKERGDTADLAAKLRERQAFLATVKAEQQRWTPENFDKLSARDRALHDKAFCTNVADPDYHQLTEVTYTDGDVSRTVRVPKGDLLHQFRRDVMENTLPTVSWVVPPERFSDHPCSAWYGAWYIAEMLDILTKNPEVWRKTIFILTYDENDGYFDHVPPFVAPDPRRPETGLVSDDIDASLEFVTIEQELSRKPANEARESPIGLGYRVPMVIASPWSRGGVVCSQVFDHTSPLQFLEQFLTRKTGQVIKESNINQWRRTVCGDLTAAFRPDRDDDITTLSFPGRNRFIESIHRAQFKEQPSGFQALSADELESIRRLSVNAPQLPRQEPGTRTSAALPYELTADATHSVDRKSISIQFAAQKKLFGERAAGAPFIVYAGSGDDHLPVRNYAVSAGQTVTDVWHIDEFADNAYQLTVYGPNGFFREFQGGISDPLLEIHLEYQRQSSDRVELTGDVEIQVVNHDRRRAYGVEISDASYGNPSQRRSIASGERASVIVNAQRTHGWYDIRVRVDGFGDFTWRYAGRVETGQWGITDPAMGQVVT